MAKNQNNRGNNRRSRSNNNNPEGRNQYNSGLMGMARERPATAAAVAAGTVAAGVFLWSKRAQITDQLSQLSDQIGEWSENLNSGNREFETVGGDSDFSGPASAGSSNELGETSSGRRSNASTAGSTRRSAGRSRSAPANTGNSGQALA